MGAQFRPLPASGQLTHTSLGRAEAAAGVGEEDSHGYEEPRALRSETRRPCADGLAPLAVYALLVAISLGAAAWNSWMAARSSAETNQLFGRRCWRLADGGGSADGVRNRDDHDYGCTIDAAQLLRRASELGQESVSNASRLGSSSVIAATSGNKGNQSTELRPLVHLGSASFPSPAPPPELKHVERWNSDSRVGSIISGSISNGAGGIVINSTGYYYVYSQVGYVLSARDVAGLSPATDHQLLRKYADSEPEVLARAQKTRCWSTKSNCSMATSYVGAVFLLRKGEVVTVDVDSVKYIWHNPQQTYLGTYLVSSTS